MPSATIPQLKEAIDAKIGVVPSKQELFFLGYPLSESDGQIGDLLQMSRTFNLVLPDEFKESGKTDRVSMFYTDKKTFLINGSKHSFDAIQLLPNRKSPIILKSKKFGLVDHIEGELRKRIFQFRVFEVRQVGSIEMTTENGEEKVYLVVTEGEREELEPINTKTYDETKKLTMLDYAVKMAKVVTPLVGLGAWITNVVNIFFTELIE